MSVTDWQVRYVKRNNVQYKMPCDSTSWTGTQVANHSWPIALASHEQDLRRFNVLMSHELGAGGYPTHAQWANEQSNILTETGETDNQQDQPQTETPTTPCRQGNPWSRVTFARNMDSAQQWWFLRFPVERRGRCHTEFPLVLQNMAISRNSPRVGLLL